MKSALEILATELAELRECVDRRKDAADTRRRLLLLTQKVESVEFATPDQRAEGPTIESEGDTKILFALTLTLAKHLMVGSFSFSEGTDIALCQRLDVFSNQVLSAGIVEKLRDILSEYIAESRELNNRVLRLRQEHEEAEARLDLLKHYGELLDAVVPGAESS